MIRLNPALTSLSCERAYIPCSMLLCLKYCFCLCNVDLDKFWYKLIAAVLLISITKIFTKELYFKFHNVGEVGNVSTL